VCAVPLAFYAPMKSPDHPAPSGDRTMARSLLKALARAGFKPEVASALRTWDRAGDAALQAEARRASEEEADRLLARWAEAPEEHPRLWFTYHIYYKAPDWIGPRVADALRIPYVVAEGSRAGKRAASPWALGHAGAEAALDRADAIFVMTEADRDMLERHRPEGQRLLDLPPFVDLDEWGASRLPASPTRRGDQGALRLLAVAMMRKGDKLESYRILAEALARVADEAWTLDVAGDGEARSEVESLFANLGPRVDFRGRLDRTGLARLYGAADLLVWPAVNEAYGMAFLEAQAFGCPVLAGRYGGVASVVRDGETGVLTPPGDAAAFADAVRRLLRDSTRRRALGEAAHALVTRERGLDQAAVRLRGALMPLATGAPAP
jgi:glycosyltransferase involved in cell wall biosynthesis